MKQGNWISHKAGAAKISACSQVYFQSCVNRIDDSRSKHLSYQPWMASKNLVNTVFEDTRENSITRFCSESVLNFSEPFNHSLNELLEIVARDEQSSSLSDVRVFGEIIDDKHKSFRDIFYGAITLIDAWSPWMQFVFKRVVKSVVPVLSIRNNNIGFSFTDHNFIGAIFSSIDPKTPYPELMLNTFLAHELGHNILMIYQHSGSFFYETEELVYSGIRKTLRPAIASFHAAVALAYLIDCTQALLKSRTDIGERAYLSTLLDGYRDGLKNGIAALAGLRKSELCQSIYEDLYVYLD